MSLRSIRVGRLAGIPIGVQPLWLLVVALITWSLGAYYYPEQVAGIAAPLAYGLGLLSALLLFASILLHELGHALVARRHGVEVEEIDLWLLGGVARMSGYPRTAGDELRFALAGPAVTLAIVVAFGALALALALSGTAPDAVQAVVQYQLFVNATILVFNLLPAFPLDGGRVARALLWRRSGDLAGATARAASVGRALGFGMIGLGILATVAGAPGGIWLALIGLFVSAAAKAEERGLLVHTALHGRAAGNLATLPAVSIPAGISLAAAAREYFVPRRYSAFPVMDGQRLVGLIDTDALEAVPVARREATRVEEAAFYDPALIVGEDQDVADLLDRPAFQRVGRALVVASDGRVGLVSITDVTQLLRALELGGQLSGHPRSAEAGKAGGAPSG